MVHTFNLNTLETEADGATQWGLQWYTVDPGMKQNKKIIPTKKHKAQMAL